ncbi:hypothetical protein CA54_57420 [Symmachiella macrocystis]|uniref:Uncharacterized protein n=1 Tax=Symmachiella macrocystis TaxID=2527985 RepID=A0A5C6B7R4_9PLAN|nr:hypothetical protein [Symmachiella macrocystis]TWU07336.1 hypothetical protein CA54_57420 [Symmachiella macrocystis]
MDPVELNQDQIRDDSSEEPSVALIQPTGDLSPFLNYKIHIVRGRKGEFDFPAMLFGRGSYGVFATNENESIPLTRKGKEIETILASEWDRLVQSDPVVLASLILLLYGSGSRETHHVLKDAAELQSMCQNSSGYELHEKRFEYHLPRIKTTYIKVENDLALVRAVTLFGRMHDKGNLGIERFSIDRNGVVLPQERELISRNIFSRIPGIKY